MSDNQQTPLMPVVSGLDAVARYALGFGTPTSENLMAARSYVQAVYGWDMSVAMADVYQFIWPDWQNQVYTGSINSTEWRLTQKGVEVVESLLHNPTSSWRRGLSRATLVTLARSRAVPKRYVHQLDQFQNLGNDLPTNVELNREGWISTEALGKEVLLLLERTEIGDPIRSIFQGVRAPIRSPAVGRVLWRLAKEGLVKRRSLKDAVDARSRLLSPPTKITTLRHNLGDPPLTPLGEHLFTTRRKSAGQDVPFRIVNVSLQIQQVAQALLKYPSDSVAAIDREHVIHLGKTSRRIDIAVWTPKDAVDRPSIWIEITTDPTKSGGTLGRIEHHIFSAAEASAAWQSPIALYIVSPSKPTQLSNIYTAINQASLSNRGKTNLTIAVVPISKALVTPVWHSGNLLASERLLRRRGLPAD